MFERDKDGKILEEERERERRKKYCMGNSVGDCSSMQVNSAVMQFTAQLVAGIATVQGKKF